MKRKMFYGAEPKTLGKASSLRKNMTLAEKILWNKLKDRKLFKTKFRRQHPVGSFIVDFYNHEFKLVIEIDGEIHENEKRKHYDSQRTKELERHGLKVLRISNHQVIFSTASTIDLILKEILLFGQPH